MYILPDYVNEIITHFNKNGYQAYIVGGSVRDLILGNQPDDYDIATDCLPEKVIELFEKTIPTGIKHGTVTIINKGKSVEVTTFRNDGKYENNRSPKNVNFIGNLKDDLARRDFTINALAYANGKLFDIFCGQDDLRTKTVRAIGDANLRFNEDALRILRAFRFASKLNFIIEKDTFEAIKKNSHLLKNISVERIFTEISKILCSDNPQFIADAINVGCLKHLSVEKIGDCTFLAYLPNRLNIRLFALANASNISALEFCRLLKTDNLLKIYCEKMDFLVKNKIKPNKIFIKNILRHNDVICVKDYFLLNEILTKEPPPYNLLEEILDNNEPYLISHLDITGDEISNIGFKDKQIGQILNLLLEYIIEHPKQNENVKLKNKVTQLYKTP